MQNRYTNLNAFLKFFIPSLIGLVLFVIPLPYGSFIPLDGISSINIGIGVLAEIFKIVLAQYIVKIALVVIVSSAILSILSKCITIKNRFFNKLLNVSPFWLICRVLGAIFIIMSVFSIGPNIITSEDTGQTILGLLPSLLAIFFVSGFLLPLVVDFGLMDLIGTIISKYMYKLFKVPGRSAIDAVSSWLGDGTLGIMITDTQYKQGYYTAKEAAIISVCFSLVSLPFSTVIADQLGLMPMFVPFYATVTLASFTCAILMPRIYPINRFKNTTYNNVEHKKEAPTPENKNLFNHALNRAITRAQNAPSLKKIIIEGGKSTLDMYLALLPLVMAWGTVALIIANFTPIFNIITTPIIYLLNICNIPNAAQAAPAILVGFTDMFIPSIMVSGDEIEPITKFIVGALSISQLIYLTETGAVILKSSIPLNLSKLFTIFLIRTIIALPIIIIIAKILF